jgi:hypothetical protein
MTAPTEFYILSLKWTRSNEECATWWGPDNSGYVMSLDNAGRYGLERVAASRGYYDNRETTLAVPCDIADKHAIRVVHSDALHRVVSETLGVEASVHAPFIEDLDDDGKPYECAACETRPQHKGPSKIRVHGGRAA